MLNIDDWRVMYEGQEDDLVQLRASLVTAEKLAAENAEKAGECDAYMRLYGEAILEIAGLKREGNAAVERAFCGAALAFADAKASIEAQSDEYKRTLTALQAARRESC
jgi:hypothetical protein